jgi:hypothetical protein
MSNWRTPGSDPSTVPVGRIGGSLTDGYAWSASCFPVCVNDRVFLLTPAHALFEAGTSSLLSIGHCKAADEPCHTVPLNSWVKAEDVDLAVAEIAPEATKGWALWPLFDGPCWSEVADGNVMTVSLQRVPEVGVQPRTTTFTAKVADEHLPEWPGEILLNHVPKHGVSGSPVLRAAEDGIHFIGLVTSAIQGDAEPQCSALRSDLIVEFVKNQFM